MSHTTRVITTTDDFAFAEVNPSISSLLNSRFAHPWKGPLLAIALRGNEADPALPLGEDVSIEDLRCVLDYLILPVVKQS